jgi:DNA repair protein RecN (Recombination protein N)
VDAGIGGATAHTVGRRLRELSKTHQVIVVTHLAQVAVYADTQLVVEKSVSGVSATTAVRRVEGLERETEIARMLSGNDSVASLTHARELLAEATATR